MWQFSALLGRDWVEFLIYLSNLKPYMDSKDGKWRNMHRICIYVHITWWESTCPVQYIIYFTQTIIVVTLHVPVIIWCWAIILFIGDWELWYSCNVCIRFLCTASWSSWGGCEEICSDKETYLFDVTLPIWKNPLGLFPVLKLCYWVLDFGSWYQWWE